MRNETKICHNVKAVLFDIIFVTLLDKFDTLDIKRYAIDKC